MSVIKKLAGDTAIYGISSVLGRLLSFMLTPIHTKLLVGQADYGLLSEIFSYIAFFNILLIFGMETTFFRYTEDEKQKGMVYNQAFLFVSAMASLFLLLGLVFHQGIAGVMNYPDEGLTIAIVVGILAMDAFAALPMAQLRQKGRAKRFATINIISIVLTVTLNTIFLLIDADITWVFVANAIASFVRMVLAMTTGLPSSWKPNLSALKPMMHYGFFIMLAGLAGMMNEVLDRTLIPRLWIDGTEFLGEPRQALEMNGIYGACYKLSMFIALFTQAFRYAAEPFFFKDAKNKNSPETIAKVFHYFFLVILAGFVMVSAFKEEIAAFNFFGLLGETTFIDKRYWEGLFIVPILLMAYVFSAMYVNMSIWFKITKQTRFAILFTGTGAVITILINVLTIPKYGFVGSAWATLICYAVMVVLVYLTGQKYYPVPYKLARMGQYLLLALVAFGINRRIGYVPGEWLEFWAKGFVVLLLFGIVYLWEKTKPSFQ